MILHLGEITEADLSHQSCITRHGKILIAPYVLLRIEWLRNHRRYRHRAVALTAWEPLGESYVTILTVTSPPGSKSIYFADRYVYGLERINTLAQLARQHPTENLNSYWLKHNAQLIAK